MEIIMRAMGDWPGQLRDANKRRASPFDSTYSATVELLERELRELRARDVILELAYQDRDFRLDHSLRANAPSLPAHPGVILSFDSRNGPLRFWTDRFDGQYRRPGWQQNLRAVALGLEALRKLDRYGITNNAEQYRGWQALGSGIVMGRAQDMTLDEAADILAGALADATRFSVLGDLQVAKQCYRRAAQELHPDVSGEQDDVAKEKMGRLSRAHELVIAHHKSQGRS